MKTLARYSSRQIFSLGLATSLARRELTIGVDRGKISRVVLFVYFCEVINLTCKPVDRGAHGRCFCYAKLPVIFRTIMKKLLGSNLLKPAVYVFALFSVFLLLISSIDVPMSWFVEDIIDGVSIISTILIMK